MCKAIDVYLEKKTTRQYVGRLQKEKRNFFFQYDEAYLKTDHPIPMGPDLPLNKKRHTALKLFPTFVDRIPSKQNPAYEEYCHSVGIKPSETNPLVLLVKLGKKGPTSFICVPVIEDKTFSSEQLKQFRKELKLSIREFSDLFDMSSATVYRIENGKTSGKDSLKRIDVYFTSPQAALDKIKTTGVKINRNKRHYVENFFKSQVRMQDAPPFPVNFNDIKRCSPEQAVKFIQQLALYECKQYNIPQNSVHFSENISAKDGGQDGLVEWSEGPSDTNYFPNRYNCFQIKKGSVVPNECKKEICNKRGELNESILQVIENKGAYVLCSTYPVSGMQLRVREEAIQETIRERGYNPDQITIKFYDANKIANWMSICPPVAHRFLEEVCNKTVEPWFSWQEWSREDSDYKSEFMYNSDLKSKQNSICKILSEPGKSVHLTGVGGVGKTRLALEAFRPTEQSDLSYLVLYSSAVNMQDFHFRALKSFRVILIIDDCSLEKAEMFHKIVLREDSQLSVLTIGDERQPVSMNTQVIELSPDEEIVKKILSDSQDITNKYVDLKLLRLTSGFPLMARLLKNLGPIKLIKKDDKFTIRKKMLWGSDQHDEEGEKVIKACSLFDTICFSDNRNRWKIISSTSIGRVAEEVKYIAEKICNIDYDLFYKKIQYFKKKKIIQQHGRFIQIRPKPLAVWLAAELIQETPPESVIKWITDMSSYQIEDDHFILNGLRESFCKQFCHLNLSAENQTLGEQLCGTGGFFGKEKILTTQWGSTCFRYLAETSSKIALKTLKRIFGNKTVEELSYFREPRRNLVWVLQKLAVRKEFYQDSARLLLQFAEAENEYHNGYPISNNSTGIFTDHFQIFLSGTEAEPDMKFKIVDEIEQSGSITQKEIAIKALEKALPKNNYYLGDDVMHTARGETFYSWRPTREESWDYFRKALEYLVVFATKDKNEVIQNNAKAVIAKSLSSLIEIENLHSDVDKAVKSVISVYGKHWPEAIRTLEQFIKYHSEKDVEKSATNVKKAKKILEQLQPKKEEIDKRLDLYIKEGNYLYDLEELRKQNKIYKKRFNDLVEDFKNYLENKNENKIISIFHPLFHGKQNNTIPFAKEVSQKLDNTLKLTTLLLDHIKEWKKHAGFDPSFLSGFLSGLNEKDSDIVQKILDNISNDNYLTDLIVPAYRSLNLKNQDIKRLIKVVTNKQVKINTNELKFLSTARKCQFVSPEIMKELMVTLINKGIEYAWVALNIYNYYVYRCESKDESERKKILLPTLYSLLTQKKLLSDKKRYNNMDDHYYEVAVRYILDSEYGERFSKNFLAQIIISDSSFYSFSIADNILRQIFSLILEKYPDTILSQIVDSKDDYKIQSICSNRYYDQNPLSVLKEKKIKEWCEKEPKKMPVFFAENIRLLIGDSWSPIAQFIFDQYGDRTDVMKVISGNIGSFSWSGSLSKYFEQRKIAVEKLRDHKHENVRKFYEKEMFYLENSIRTEKQREREREEFGIFGV